MIRKHIPEEKMVDDLTGNLSGTEHFQVQSHLAVCTRCANRYEAWNEILDQTEVHLPSPELKKRVFTTIQQKKQRKYRPLSLVAIAVSLFIVLVSGIFQFKNSPESVEMAEDSIREDIDFLTDDEFIRYFRTLDPKQMHSVSIPSHSRSVKLEIEKIGMHAFPNQQTVVKAFMDSTQEKIIFATKHGLCAYDPKEKYLLCLKPAKQEQEIKIIPIKRNHFNLQ